MDNQAWARRLRIDLIEKDYGDTAQQVLDLCALVAEAESSWSSTELKAFLKEVGTNPMVWRRLFSIAQDKRLPALVENLPSSYSALYALTNFSDQELEAAVKGGVISAQSSSRQILDWVKQFRVDNGSGESKAEVLYLRVDPKQTQEQRKSLFDALVAIADEHGAQLVTDSGQLTKRYSVNQQRMEAGKRLRYEMSKSIQSIYYRMSEETRSRFGVSSTGEVLDLDLSLFGQFLIASAGSRIAMFEQYGSIYCNKIAYEHTQAEDRSQRFNYKRRLIQCKALCPDASELIDKLLIRYMSF